MKIRCSSIHKIIGEPKLKKEKLSQTAKSYLLEVAKEELFGFTSFTGNKQTEKGILLEDIAIQGSGLKRGLKFEKNQTRKENDWITGECDIYYPKGKLIIDTKCPWDIGTQPFFRVEAEDKVVKAGYDWQMQGYMWLYDCEQADIDFWLLPCPEELLGAYDDREQLIEAVERIPLLNRVTTVTIMRDEEKIEKIKEKVEACQEYYEQLIKERKC